MKQKVVSLGETMLRMSPLGSTRLDQTNNCETVFGGSEANVAVALATYGINSVYVTKLPDNAFGQAALNTLRQHGVETSRIIRGGERIGMYLLEGGYTPCSNICTYDRKHSAIADADPAEFDWHEIFRDAAWFHFSGITPALSPSTLQICEDACRTAHEMGLIISCDVNYRSKLWTMDAAAKAMQKLCRLVNVLIVNEEEAKVLGIDVTNERLTDHAAFTDMCTCLRETYPAAVIGSVARINLATAVKGMLCVDGQIYESETYTLHIKDPIGAGDAFSAALIYGLLNNEPAHSLVNIATAACAIKHCIKGDFNLVSMDEIRGFAAKAGADAVKR